MDQRLPLYQRLRDNIADSIARQVWRPGDPIPTEIELASQHRVAVGTVRKAIDVLTSEGLVERQQGRGTFVRRRELASPMLRFFRHDGGTVPGSRLLEREAVEAPGEAVRAALRLPAGEGAVRLTRLRLAADRPLLREEIWLPLARFEVLLTAAESAIGDLLYPAYERLCGAVVARASETLTVGRADADDERLLGIERGGPVIVIERLAVDFAGEPIEWRRTHGAAGDFRYKVDIC